jgi:hypothetical protein
VGLPRTQPPARGLGTTLTLKETITGFHFAIGEPAPAVNPGKRMGWAFAGPGGFTQLQQFFY